MTPPTAIPSTIMKLSKTRLAAFSEKLAEKPQIVVATKLDATTDRARLEKLRDFCAARGLEGFTPFHPHRAKAFRNWCGPWPTRSIASRLMNRWKKTPRFRKS